MVHYGQNYDNAFWDNVRNMFFGDGDGQILTQTTAGIDVVGHELTHGVTQHEANLTYSGQSGALNESISDVFGIQVKQFALNQDVTQSDWLIGADIVGPALKPALRSMKAPGTANPHDTQPADMDGYVQGGDVHTNSGIPNRAFYLAAIELGGNAYGDPGKIWYQESAEKANNLVRIDPATLKFTVYTMAVKNASVRSITRDARGRLWMPLSLQNKIMVVE